MHTYIPIILSLFFVPTVALASQPYERDFVLTAYYSPLPGQAAYILGGEEADKVLNGQGTHAADGTPVYPGMIAAPASYPFGTRISLPGLGVFEVHDRGGAILAREESDRLDIWAGHGDDALARALAFGVEEVRGTVYLPGSDQPDVSFDVAALPSPDEMIEDYVIEKWNLMSMKPRFEDNGLSVRYLQDHLRAAGYFDHAVTGYFGPVTRESLQRFITDHRIDESADALGTRTAAFLIAASLRSDAGFPISGFIDDTSSRLEIQQAQRLMRFLGYYQGRTDGTYSDTLYAAILRFQQEHSLVGDASSPGAGRIGPLTTAALSTLWNRHVNAALAERYLLLHEVDTLLSSRGNHVERFLGEGHYGDQVRTLQRLLADRGFFPAEKINGSFGPITKQAVMAYQLDRELIKNESDAGAGYVGIVTLRSLRSEQRRALYRLVRAQGKGVL